MGQNEKKDVRFEISSMECDERKSLKFNDDNYSKARQNPKKNDNPKEE